MSDIDLVIKASKKLEYLLSRQLGARGKGLHQKLSNVERKLSSSLVKRLRYIATVRNKLVHDNEYNKLDDKRGFKRAVKQSEKELKVLNRKPAKRWLFGLVFVLLLLALLLASPLLQFWHE
ncbi:MAG: DUF4145 domain-containing protein [Gammaproteobacteria bacterium]|nr:DUF4145 domain-containing protein [Gammaproteobacteria bacterium]